MLKAFNEPSWNYQVIRFINSDGKDIIPRKDRVWDVKGVAERMRQSLMALGKDVPPGLKEL